MKHKRLITFVLSLFSTISYSQTIENVIDNLMNSQNRQSSVQNIIVDFPNCSHEFNQVDLFKTNNDNFRLISDNDNFKLQIVSIKRKMRGFVIDLSKNTGYKLSYDKSLIYKEVEKDELILICGNNNPSENIKADSYFPVDVKPEYGNSKQVTNVKLLESRAGATNLIYLDVDGEASFQGFETQGLTNAINMNIPDNVTRQIWESIAEDFLPFDVNVTTNRALFDAHPELQKSWVIVSNFNRSWNGIASMWSFGSGRPVLMNFPPSYDSTNVYHKHIISTSSHELGHALGLSHDGVINHIYGYYDGHGEFSPIMGNGSRPVTHWSKGEYPSGNTQDDIHIISEILGYVMDDYPTIKDLEINGIHVDPNDNFGEITMEDDLDTFRLNLPEGGQIKLTVSSPLGIRTNLDVFLQLLTEDKTTILTTNNLVGDRNGYLDEIVPPGIYYIVVDGGGELNPSYNGFSDYSSFGYYEISGLVGNSTPTCQFSVTNPSTCIESPINIVNESYGNNLNYEWTVTDLGVFSDTIPNLAFTSGGNKTISLKVSNDKGENTCSQVVKIGENYARIILPKNKLNDNFIIKIDADGEELINLTRTDFIELNSQEYYSDICLATGCYELKLTDIYKVEACGTPNWSSSSIYNGGDKVIYNGKRYKANWWIQGSAPGNTGAWSQIGACEITDSTTTISILDLSIGDTLFKTNPAKVGSDLFEEGNFCFGILSSINLITNKPSTCGEVEFKTNSNGSNITWNFGTDANPQSANGKGIHKINYSTSGLKTIALNIDGVIENREIEIEDGSSLASIQISSPTTVICLNDTVRIKSYVVNGGNALIEWFLDGDQVASGNDYYTDSLETGTVINAKLKSDELCIENQTVFSNSLTFSPIDCATNIRKLKPSFDIFPNPVCNILMIKGEGINSVKIYNQLGEVLKSHNVRTQNYKIDCKNLNKGAYFVEIQHQSGVYLEKFIKK